MAEHFPGSPSHRFGPAKNPDGCGLSPESHWLCSEIVRDESRGSLRHLLQMHVPPRAFGRRYRQLVVNPLSNVVRSTGGPGRY